MTQTPLNQAEDAASEPGRGVYQRSVESGSWYLFGVGLTKFINLGTFFVLARLLVPEDYGVIAVTMFAVGLLDKLTEPGFGTAMLQRKGSIEPLLDAVWTFDVVRRASLAAVLFLGGGWIADYFHVPASQTAVVQAGSLLLLIGSLGNVRIIHFHRGLNYKKVFLRDLAAQVALTAVAILAAATFAPNAWALFYGQLAFYVASLIASYTLVPSWPRFDFSFGKLRTLFGFGKWVYGQNLLEYVFQYFDKLFVGRMLDASSLGVYAKAKEIGGVATGTIQSMIGKIAFPALSRLQGEIDKVQRGFLKSIDVLLIAAVPFGVLLALQGGAIVQFFFGDNWIALTLVLKLFAIGHLVLAVNAVFQTVFASLGRPDVNFGLNVIQFGLTVPAAWIGFRIYHSPGLAVGIICTWLVTLGLSWFMAGRVFRIGMPSLRPAFWSAVSASGVALALDLVGREAVLATNNLWIAMAWVALLGIAFYIVLFGVSYRLKAGPWHTAVGVAKELGILATRGKNV